MGVDTVYTPLHPLDQPREDALTKMGAGVKIHDLNGLESWYDDEWGSTDTEMVTTKVTDRDEYPATEWEYLTGFRTWDEDVCDSPNIANYHPEDDESFWGTVSTFTAPFQCWVTTSSWPSFWTLLDHGTDLWHVTADDGDVEVTRVEISDLQDQIADQGGDCDD